MYIKDENKFNGNQKKNIQNNGRGMGQQAQQLLNVI